MAPPIAGKFIPAVKTFIKNRAAKAVSAGAPTAREAMKSRVTQMNAGYSTLGTLVETGNPLAAASAGALDFGISAIAAPKLQRAMLASKNPLIQAAAGPATLALDLGSTFFTPDLFRQKGKGEQQPQQNPNVPTTVNQNTQQAISDPTNEVAARNALVNQLNPSRLSPAQRLLQRFTQQSGSYVLDPALSVGGI